MINELENSKLPVDMKNKIIEKVIKDFESNDEDLKLELERIDDEMDYRISEIENER